MPRVSVNAKQYKLKDLMRFIKGECKDKKITQKELGQLLGIGQSCMSQKFESGDLSAADLIAIFERLETSPERIGKLLSLGKD